MISRKFKIIESLGGKEYIFSSYAFKVKLKEYVISKNAHEARYTISMAKTELAEYLCVSEEAIKNWLCGYNGPSDIEVVKNIANFIGVDYKNLICEEENNTMNNNDKVLVPAKSDSKDVVRFVYQQIAAFFDEIVEMLPYEFGGEEEFKKYEKKYNQLILMMHQNMFDIPLAVYNDIIGLINNDIEYLLYGEKDLGITIWEESEYWDLCRSMNMEEYAVYPMQVYIQKKSDEFYENVRKVLKDYMVG